jgi:hypothetical protein
MIKPITFTKVKIKKTEKFLFIKCGKIGNLKVGKNKMGK